jgi:hypothetical protein
VHHVRADPPVRAGDHRARPIDDDLLIFHPDTSDAARPTLVINLGSDDAITGIWSEGAEGALERVCPARTSSASCGLSGTRTNALRGAPAPIRRRLLPAFRS